MTEVTTTDAPEADANWDAEREALKAMITDRLKGRAQTQGWLNAKGKLSAKGQHDALEMLIGIATGFELAGHPRLQWMLGQCFLASCRGVDSLYDLTN